MSGTEDFLAKYLALISTFVVIAGGFLGFLQYNKILKKERKEEREHFLQSYKKTILDELDDKFREIKSTIHPVHNIFGTIQIIDELNRLRESIGNISREFTIQEIESIKEKIESIKAKVIAFVDKK